MENSSAPVRPAVVAGALALVALLAAVTWALRNGSGYMPHGHCYRWEGGLVALHAGSDLVIGGAYLAISATLSYLVSRARGAIPFDWVLVAFGTFIVACGGTHLMEVWTLWNPWYRLAGELKLVTAVVSVATAVALPPLVPRILALVRADHVARERERALVAEQAARESAEAASRAKDQFLAMVSHELRNPLSPILAWSQMLRMRSFDAATTTRALEVIERNARAQAQLVEDLLDVSRIVSGRLRLDVRRTPLAGAVEAAAESVRLSAQARDVRLALALDPAAAVVGDPDRLRQVAWNLLSNAVKFTPRGGSVDVRVEAAGAHVLLAVRDTGRGLSAGELPHVFERFWQSDGTPTRAHGGLGLGLAIVRHLVELHGGTVSASSEGPGRGATFRVELPAAPAAAVAAAADAAHVSAAEGRGSTAFAALDAVRVLVLDDDPDSNEAVKEVLAYAGAEVRVAGAAAQAREILDRWLPDVIVADIGMPGEDGYAFIADVRGRPRALGGAVPAVALTAFARSEDRVRVLAAGFQMHVAKPFDPAELTYVVASLAGRRPRDAREPGA
jgi:signal transduction histidine kinase/ActR/RegA family two-component response regulator